MITCAIVKNMKICTISKCNGKYTSKGLCSKHYQAVRRNGSIDIVKSERHGMYGTETYVSYTKMKSRCLNKNASNFKYYGGRGITICERWINSFSNFLDDMGIRPPNTSLDRIDNNGNYEPSNCRWTNTVTQSNNRRVRSDNISGYKGVSFQKRVGNYNARIYRNGVSVNLGYYPTAELASNAYNKAVYGK